MIKAKRRDKNHVEVAISGNSEDLVIEALFMWVYWGIECDFNKTDYIDMALRAYDVAEDIKGGNIS